MAGSVLDRRSLNRATLERQLLVRRDRADVVEAVERIGGLNAQHANDPYLALACRLDGFQLADLTRAIEDRKIVRSIMMRGTQHLMSTDEFRRLRPVMAPLFARLQRNTFGRRTEGVDIERLVADAREILADGVWIRPELGRMLAERHPGATGNALVWSVQYLLPVVHPAPSGMWDSGGATPLALAETWTGPFDPPEPKHLVRRYLAAFGPATVADMRAWSGVSRLAGVVAGMRDELLAFRDERGRELFDLPDAPRPAPDTPVPVRLLGGYDNLLLAHHDRTRVMTDEVRGRVCVGDLVEQTLLVDGMVAGLWRLDRTAGRVTVLPFETLSRAEADAVTEEGVRLLDAGPRLRRLPKRPFSSASACSLIARNRRASSVRGNFGLLFALVAAGQGSEPGKGPGVPSRVFGDPVRRHEGTPWSPLGPPPSNRAAR